MLQIHYHDQSVIKVNGILEMIIEFMLSQLAHTNWKSRNKFSYFMITTIYAELAAGLMHMR